MGLQLHGPRGVGIMFTLFLVAAGLVLHTAAQSPPDHPIRINVRWAEDVPDGQRTTLEAQYQLHEGEFRGERTWSYEIRDFTQGNLRRLVLDEDVVDTHGVDRAQFVLSEWPVPSAATLALRAVALAAIATLVVAGLSLAGAFRLSWKTLKTVSLISRSGLARVARRGRNAVVLHPMASRFLTLAVAVSLAALVVLSLLSPVPPSPRVNVRWQDGLSDQQRLQLESDFQLQHGEPREGTTFSYELVDVSTRNIREMLAAPEILDTHGIHRDNATIVTPVDRGDQRPILPAALAAGFLLALFIESSRWLIPRIPAAVDFIRGFLARVARKAQLSGVGEPFRSGLGAARAVRESMRGVGAASRKPATKVQRPALQVFLVRFAAQVSVLALFSLSFQFATDDLMFARYQARIPSLRELDWFYHDIAVRQYLRPFVSRYGANNLVAVVGDSVVYSHGNRPSQAAAATLDVLARATEGSPARVLNLGATGTAESYLNRVFEICLELGIGNILTPLNTRDYYFMRTPGWAVEPEEGESQRFGYKHPGQGVWAYGGMDRGVSPSELALRRALVRVFPWMSTSTLLLEDSLSANVG